MSTERALSEWIAELVARLDLDPAGGGRRLRAVVEGRTARIRLDGETVLVSMRAGQLVVEEDRSDAPVNGTGRTTSEVVLGILEGRLEVAVAVERGWIEVTGQDAETARLFHAVELLLDGSSRVPELRQLADEFVSSRAGLAPRSSPPAHDPAGEQALLARLGLGAEP